MRGRGALAIIGSVLLIAAVVVLPRLRRRPVSTLPFEVSGCASIDAAGRCERPASGILRVVTRQPVVLRTPSGPLAARAQVAVDGGTRAEIVLDRATTIKIAHDGAEAELVVVDPPSWSWLPRARTQRDARDLEGLRASVTPAIADGDPAERAVARGLLARGALAHGAVDEALRLFDLAIADDHAAGRISDAVEDAFAKVFVMTQRRTDYAEAARLIADAERWSVGYADGRARLPYYRALIAGERGDLRSAIFDLVAAETLGERLGLSRAVWNARSSRALLLERLGRFEEAIALLRALDRGADPAITACDRAHVRHNLAFGLLAARIPAATACGATSSEDPEPLLALAEESYERGCPDPQDLALLRVLRAEAAIARGDQEAAARLLARARETTTAPSAELARRWLDVEGTIALASGRTNEALATYDRLIAIARAAGRIDDERRGHEGRGETFERLGDRNAAIEAYAEADRLVDQELALVPFGEGRVPFAASRDRAARALIELLADRGEVGRARDVARHARARVVAALVGASLRGRVGEVERRRIDDALARYRRERRALDQSAAEDWRRPWDELPRVVAARKIALDRLRAAVDEFASTEATAAPPRAREVGEVVVTIDPLRRGTVVFVEEDRLRASIVPTDREGLAERLVAPAIDAIRRARRVRFEIAGGLGCIDPQVVPLDGMPIGLVRPVAFATDAAPGPAKTALLGDRGAARSALVVGDPRADLRAARDEAAAIHAHFEARGISTTLLVGRRADALAVRDALAKGPAFFHFAGHGVFAAEPESISSPFALSAARADGAASGLALANGTSLEVLDVLSLTAAPNRVVLSACEAARRAEAGAVVGLGIADAFVLAGARAVVAPTRKVGDRSAARIAETLARTELADPSTDPARTLQLSLRGIAPHDSTWTAYRLFEP
jgi:tetratricopeptide (TPR) repeat protein